MTNLTIRKSGNAQIVSLPKIFLEQLGVGVGNSLSVKLKDNKIVLQKSARKRRAAEELFQGVTPEMFQTPEDMAWLEMPSVGREKL